MVWVISLIMVLVTGGLVLGVGVRRSHLAMTAGRHVCSYTSTENTSMKFKSINEISRNIKEDLCPFHFGVIFGLAVGFCEGV